MKKRMIAIAAATMATMMMATPVLAEDYKIGICNYVCLLYTSPSPRDQRGSRMPSSA